MGEMIALQALRNVMPYDFEVVSKLYNDFYILLRLATRPLVGLEAIGRFQKCPKMRHF